MKHPHLRLVEPPKDYEVAYYRSDNIRSVRPISAHHIEELFGVPDEPVDLHAVKLANDLAYRAAERRALGGKIGLACMVLVAALIGVLLATGGVL